MERRKRNITGKDGFKQGGGKTVQAAGAEFIRHHKAKNSDPHTVEYHTRGIDRLIEMIEYLGIENIEELTESGVDEFVNYRLSCGIKPATINQNFRSWRPFGNFLVKREYLKHNPLDVSQLKIEKKIIQSFDRHQLKLLMNAMNLDTFCGLRNYTMMMLWIETGSRRDESLAICLDDIDWNRGQILINGKGRKQRYVPFQESFRKILRNYLKVRGRLPTDALFVSDCNNPLKSRSVNDYFVDLGQKTRLPISCTPHVFRFTFARMYIENGGDILSLKDILGHTSLAQVLHYCDMWGKNVVERHAKFSPLERLFNDDN